MESALETDPDTVVNALVSIQSYFHNAGNAMAVFAGSKESAAANRPLADAFLNKLENEPVAHVAYDLPVPAKREGLILDLNVNFNALAADYPTVGLDAYNAGLDAVMSLVSDMYLIPQLRDQYGVYSPLAGAIEDGGVYLITYRDPNITETFDVYASLADQIASLDVDQDTLNGYILSSYAYYARSSGELTGALNAAMTLLEGKTQEQTIEYMQQLKALTPESVKASAELFRKLSENGVRSTAGSASAVQAHADLYEVVLNPFNAADASSIELTDAPEDSAYYTAVRFAFEEGLMAPAEENAFGVDQPATVGDLAGAIYVLIGGSLGDAQEAIATLGAYGIVSPDAQADTALTQGDADAILVNLMAAMGAEGAYTPSAENGDLPLTRGALAELLHTLFSE